MSTPIGDGSGTGADAEGAFRLGGAIVSLVEPHPGHARAFHRWYERDHFHAACMTGPGFFAGRRFVATAALKALRPPAGRPAWPGDPGRGTFLTLYWLDADAQDEAADWSIERFHALRAQGRIFREADLVHGGFYRVAAVAQRDPDGVPATLALDHPFPGVALTVVETEDPKGLVAWQRDGMANGSAALSVGLAPRPRPEGTVRGADPNAHPDRMAWLHFSDAPAQTAFADSFAGHAAALERAGVGHLRFAAPFLPTVPGTDRYLDEL